MESTLT